MLFTNLSVFRGACVTLYGHANSVKDSHRVLQDLVAQLHPFDFGHFGERAHHTVFQRRQPEKLCGCNFAAFVAPDEDARILQYSHNIVALLAHTGGLDHEFLLTQETGKTTHVIWECPHFGPNERHEIFQGRRAGPQARRADQDRA